MSVDTTFANCTNIVFKHVVLYIFEEKSILTY